MLKHKIVLLLFRGFLVDSVCKYCAHTRIVPTGPKPVRFIISIILCMVECSVAAI